MTYCFIHYLHHITFESEICFKIFSKSLRCNKIPIAKYNRNYNLRSKLFSQMTHSWCLEANSIWRIWYVALEFLSLLCLRILPPLRTSRNLPLHRAPPRAIWPGCVWGVFSWTRGMSMHLSWCLCHWSWGRGTDQFIFILKYLQFK